MSVGILWRLWMLSAVILTMLVLTAVAYVDGYTSSYQRGYNEGLEDGLAAPQPLPTPSAVSLNWPPTIPVAAHAPRRPPAILLSRNQVVR